MLGWKNSTCVLNQWFAHIILFNKGTTPVKHFPVSWKKTLKLCQVPLGDPETGVGSTWTHTQACLTPSP